MRLYFSPTVIEADGTVIFECKKSAGSIQTSRLCIKHHKPVLKIHPFDDQLHNLTLLSQFVLDNNIRVLNLAGHRESVAPGIAKEVATQIHLLCSQQQQSPFLCQHALRR
ncbi:YpsA SLOG family protein [Ferrimonas kyonanensis]|uniref:YpsA SLOG family protein n=1 Tax=Ferrimonas kyonanensis TaxID=364763 RepID=UPI000481AC19